MEDDDLVARAKAGDPDAWRELYRAHAGRLVAWLRSRPTGDAAAEADDIASEAWLVAADKIADFTGTSEQFAGYLFGVARKLSASTHRRSQRRQTSPAGLGGPAEPLLDQGNLAQPGPAPDHTVVLDQQAWVRELLSLLPEREREAVGLVDGVGLDMAGAARALGISTVAVRVARHRGLRRLRDHLPTV